MAETGKSFFIVNHWINSGGVPDPVEAAKTNSEATITKRVQQCIATRGKMPNAIAVDFTASGDLFKTVKMLNSAIARQAGVTQRIDEVTAAAHYFRDSPLVDAKERKLYAKDVRNIKALHRLPNISQKKVLALLGPLADTHPLAPSLDDMVEP